MKEKKPTVAQVRERLSQILKGSNRDTKADIASLLRELSPPPEPLKFKGRTMEVTKYDDGTYAHQAQLKGGELRVTPQGEVELDVYTMPYASIQIHYVGDLYPTVTPQEALERFLADLPKVLPVLTQVVAEK